MERPQAQVNDISKMDRQALLGTFTEAGRVLAAYEDCRDRAEQLINKTKKDEDNFATSGLRGGLSPEAVAEAKRRDEIMKGRLRKEYTLVYMGLVGIPVSIILAIAGAASSSSILLVLALVIFILLIVVVLPASKKITKGKAELGAELDVEGQTRKAVQPKVDMALTACEQSLALNAIPRAYRYTYAMKQMGLLVENFRANTWMEAADKFEEMVHRVTMETLMEENNELLAINNFYQQQIAKNTRAAALFSGLTWLNTL